MRYAKIRKMDISNGPGIRVSIFVQGCSNRCPGCFNKETWDYTGGELWTDEINEYILNCIDNPTRQGLSILGGDPFSVIQHMKIGEKNYILDLVKEVKKRFPEKDIWLWTGFKIEPFIKLNPSDIIHEHDALFTLAVQELLPYIDVIVDGPFVQELKDMRMKYAGSSNQRVIDIKESLKQSEIILYER